MKFSLRVMFETLLRGLRLVGLQACEDALSDNRNRIFLKNQPLGDNNIQNDNTQIAAGQTRAHVEELNEPDAVRRP